MPAPPSPGAALPPVSPALWRFFARYTRSYVGKHFGSLRVLSSALPPPVEGQPLVVYLNHASWWDPLVSLLVAEEFFSDRTGYAPIEAAMLQRYGIFRRLGFFPVEPGQVRGGRDFLRAGRAVLASPKRMLWLTPQGRFMDPRERPLRFASGLGALAAREPRALFLPLAIEYTFWSEPRPEILAAFGEPIVPGDTSHTPAEWTSEMEEALEAAQDHLAERSCRRDPAEWRVLHRGRSGIAGIYDVWRKLWARLRGQSFAPGHLPESRA